MAKRNTPSKTPAKTPAKSRIADTKPAVDAVPETPVIETAARKTVAPKTSPAGVAIAVTHSKAPVPLTYERIAERAYFISQNGGSSEYDNWLRAENELKSETV